MFSSKTSVPLADLPDSSKDGKASYRLSKSAAAMAAASPLLSAVNPALSVVSGLFREDAAATSAREDAIRALLAARAFDFDNPPPKPRPVFKLGGQTICTPGNLTVIQGPVKAGKSAVIAAMMAAVLSGDRQGPDTLGFSSENPEARAFLHFDTEQSRFDSDALIRRSMERARAYSLPPWFQSYTLTDLGIDERKAAVAIAVKDAAEKHGGIHAVIFDGVADICTDPNDPAESFALVGSLHSAAISYDCPFVLVLHENPGSETGKTRGHLGSQLARKAETPLRLHKDESTGISTVWADRARHCHIPRSQGTCFQWSDAAGMHISCGTAREITASAKRAKFEDEAGRAFGDDDRLTYTELRDRLIETAGIAKKTAEARVASYAAEGLIVKGDDGKYAFTPGLPLTLKLPSKDPSRA